jgi:hypothetical protein
MVLQLCRADQVIVVGWVKIPRLVKIYVLKQTPSGLVAADGDIHLTKSCNFKYKHILK